MFLDDQIVKMVLDNDPLHKDWDNQKRLVTDIIKLCRNRLSELLRENEGEENIVPLTKRVCNLFDSAARQLNEKGYSFLLEGGFKKHLLSKPGLAEILNKLNFK